MPPELTDEIQDMAPDSSAEAPQDAVATTDKSVDVTDASSSTATDATETDLLSVVRDVVDQRQKPDTAAPSAEGEVAGQEADDQIPKEPDDDYSDVPFNKHPRFQQIIRERNELRTDSVEYHKITSYMDANGLTQVEAANGLQIMALAKLDPVEAWKQLKPFVQNVLIAAGEVLPDDLRKRVEAGELPESAAKEVSRARAAQASLEARQKFQSERGQRQQQTGAAEAVRDAAVEWENGRKLKDPNFAAKQPQLMREVAFLHATEGRPTTPDGVKAQLKKAYDTVNKGFKAPAPVQTQRKPAITPIRGGQVAGNARPADNANRSTLDVIREARRQRSA